MERTALVTGASGYLGAPLVQCLSDNGWRVRPVARTLPLRTSPLQWRHPEAVTDAAGSAIAHAWQPTATDFDGVDAVFHLAGIAHQKGQSDPAMYHQANALASEAIALRAAAHGVKHFLLVSSVSAIGRAPASGLLTPDSPMQPVTSYGQSKMTAERLVTETLTGTPTELTILRPPLVYGPHPKGNLRLLVQMLRTGLPLPLAGINNQRSMIATPNLISLLANLACDTRAYSKVLMPSDITISTTQLVCRLCYALDRKPRLFALPASVLQAGTRLPLVGTRLGRVLEPLLTSLAIQDSFLTDNMGWQPGIAPDTVLKQMVQSVPHR